MNKTIAETKEFIHKLIPQIRDITSDVWLAPPFTAIHAAVHAAQGSQIKIGGQTMSGEDSGAFTGEVSGNMLKEAGAQFVILGHSERRILFQEKNDQICQKLKQSLALGLTPILCVGESEQEKERGETAEILEKQLEGCLQDIPPFEIILAYEPVWAIGTGKTASPDVAASAHQICLDFLAGTWGAGIAKKASLLYGGSVTQETVKTLLQQPSIHGVLVGGASLDVDKFVAVLKGAQS
jgi:triosephosphate isomerase